MSRYFTALGVFVAFSATTPAIAQTTIVTTPQYQNRQVIYLDNSNRLISPAQGASYNLGRATGFLTGGGRPNNRVTIQGYSTNNGIPAGNVVRDPNGGIAIYGADGHQTGSYSGGRFTPAR